MPASWARCGRGKRWQRPNTAPRTIWRTARRESIFRPSPRATAIGSSPSTATSPRLTMDVDEKGGLFEGYELKLNSYDLGVDIELADAIERLRFEHPQVRAVVLRSGKPRVFCAGANIRMLAGATHAHKVNFCKFTNETRNGIEDFERKFRRRHDLRDQRHRGRRRLRAGAGNRSHHAGGRRLVVGGAARIAAARGAAGHRRAHARVRQAQGASRPCRRVLHHRGRHQGQARGRVAAGGRSGAGVEIRRCDLAAGARVCRQVASWQRAGKASSLRP